MDSSNDAALPLRRFYSYTRGWNALATGALFLHRRGPFVILSGLAVLAVAVVGVAVGVSVTTAPAPGTSPSAWTARTPLRWRPTRSG
jgi:hypothetical protein